VDNELISSVLFEFVRDNAGVEETYQTLKLTNAAVSALRRHSDEISIDGAAQVSAEFEDVSFVNSHIEVTNIAGGGTTRRMTRRFFNRRKAISLTQLS
jgi:type VI protein secretion system component Hcp